LRDSEQHFRTIAESHPVPVAVVRLEGGRIVHASQAFADLFGMALDELPGQDIAGFYADLEQRARLRDELRRTARCAASSSTSGGPTAACSRPQSPRA
jgi:PAS domain S-box-containing protein